MKEHIISDEQGKYTEVLPVVTIYGANASGKTNLVNAIEFMQKKVLRGTRPDSLTGVIPHKLDPDIEKNPSRFEIIFKHEGVLYTYGFVISPSIIHEEWLFAYFTSQESKIFERITKNNKTIVEPGNRLVSDVESPEFIKYISQGTRPNQLFLTEGHEKNIKILQPVIHWFKDHLQIIKPHTQYSALTLRAHEDSNFIEYLSRFLHVADTGINKITCESEEFDPDKHLKDVPKFLLDKINEDLNTKAKLQILIQSPTSTLALAKQNAANGIQPTVFRLKTEHTRTDGRMNN